MKIDQLLVRGLAHPHFCEDALLYSEVGHHRWLIAVMDGCSNGIESHFASTLKTKMLQKISKEWYYRALHLPHPEPKLHLGVIIKSLFNLLKQQQQLLQLSPYELLSTVLIGLVDAKDKTGTFVCIGDGYLIHQGEWWEFEQNNQPDYLAYHLGMEPDNWYQKLNPAITIDNINQLTLATDGIHSFEAIHPDYEMEQKIHIPNYLTGSHDLNLYQRFRIIESEWKFAPVDDLALVQIHLEA